MKAIVQQKSKSSGKSVLLTAIRFDDLLNKAKITFKTETDDNPYENWDGTGSKDLYQRKLDPVRVRNIADYIKKSINSDSGSSRVEKPLFPNSMILAVQVDALATEAPLSIIDLDWDSIEKVYIVDGQHRFAGMRLLYEKLQENAIWPSEEAQRVLPMIKQYCFNCTILVNYDLWEQAEIFADINFKQKKVNKSLYYEIYGQYPPERAEDYERSFIFLAHNLVNVLNYNELSPLKGMVKMLGTGSGTISQAYLVEALSRHIQPDKGIWHYNPFDDSFSNKTYMHMSVELLSFFTAVKNLFSDYFGNPKSILSKTSGLGAMIRLIKDVHDRLPSQLKADIREYTSVSLNKEYIDFTMRFLKPLEPFGERLFGQNSQYAGGGGSGNVVRMYNDILRILNDASESLF